MGKICNIIGTSLVVILKLFSTCLYTAVIYAVRKSLECVCMYGMGKIEKERR